MLKVQFRTVHYMEQPMLFWSRYTVMEAEAHVATCLQLMNIIILSDIDLKYETFPLAVPVN